MSELTKLMNDIIGVVNENLRVCLPAKIEDYDPDTQLATVQPLSRVKLYGYKESQSLPFIHRVPVIHPRTASSIIRLPVVNGDICTLIFADRSIENWVAGDGAEKDTLDIRMHHLDDAYAILGGYPEGNPRTANNPDALEIEVDPGAKITIGNGTDELLQLAYDAFVELKNLTTELSTTLTNIQAITVTGNSGAPTSTPINAASFASTKTNVDNITNTVDTVIQSLNEIKV